MNKKMHLLHHLPKLCVLLFSLLVFCVNAAYSGRPATVEINKCCRLGEYLDSSQVCVAGGSEKWVPKVYLLQRKAFYNKTGEAPPHMKINEKSLPNACESPIYFNGSDQIILFSNASLFLSQKHVIVPPNEYCVEKDAALACIHVGNGMDSLMAPQILSKVKKCCGPNAAYKKENGTCVILDKSHELYSSNIITSPQIELLYGFPECLIDDYAIAGVYKNANLKEETGTVMIDSGKLFSSNEYCVEHVLEDKSVNVFTCSEHFQPASVHVAEHDVRFTLYSTGLLISVIFLLATLAAGYLVPSNHHVLHWRCQTHYVACLLVGDFILAITQLSANSINGHACTIMAISMHFFFLAAFFWLNTMCFNIWWTFRDFRPTSLEKGQELCRLRIYEIYAWGVPLLIAGVAAILDNLPENSDETFLRPRFGEAKCWFYGDMEILTYFFGPIGILLCVNLLLFASTARQLTCGLWKRDDVKSTTERAALGRVCLKLVVVMGVTWGADVISWAVGGPNYAWYVTDLINALQGVFIFIVVGCQPQVWSAMKRLWSSKTGRSFTNTTNGPQHSSSSHGLPSMGESVTNNTFTNNTSTKIPMETVC